MSMRHGSGFAATLGVVVVALLFVVRIGHSLGVEPDHSAPSLLTGESSATESTLRGDVHGDSSTVVVRPTVVAYELAEMSAAEAETTDALDARPLVLLSDQELARGRTSAASGIAGVEAIVYENIIDRGIVTVAGQRFNFAAQSSDGATNDLGFSLGIGTFIADDMLFDQGFGVHWRLGDQISSFSAFVRRSDEDETRFIGDGTTRATLTLWDGDPTRAIDTARRGYAGAPIAGASCDFTLSPDVGVGTLQKLRCNLANPITPPHNGVWMVLTGDSCGLFWPITLRTAKRGVSRDVGILGQDDDAGALGSLGTSTTATDGNCCAGGATCGPNGVAIDCDGGTDNASGRCSDGDAETHVLFNFGGSCVGNPAIDSCANYLAEIHAPAKTTISLVPVGGTGHTSINGNEIVYATGGGTVELEVRLGTWDPDGVDERIFAWHVGLDPAGYTSALVGTLTPRSVPCTTDADCVPIFGGVCDVSGTRCVADGDCPLNETCGGLKCKKRFRADPAGSEVCLPAYIMSDRSDYVFSGLFEAQAVDVESGRCSTSGRLCTETGGCLFEEPQINETCVAGAFRWASTLNGAFPILPPSPFPVEGFYAGTLQLDISPDAKGTFTLGLLPASDSVMLLASGDLSTPLVGMIPAKITIPAGQCCDAALSPLCASGTITIGECLAQGGLFDPTKTCTDACECLPSSSAVPDRILNRNGVLVTSVKNRFLSFSGEDAGLMQAVRVKFVSLPGAFSVFDGTSLWVDLPRAASELPGKSFADPVGTDASFQVAGLRATPFYIDWSEFGVVHVTDERIIPSRKRPSFPLEPAVYEIQIVAENCHTGTDANFSPALRITNARWADIGDSDGRAFLAPDGTVSVSDVLAIIAKFSSSDKAPIKARAELLGSGPNGPVGRVDGVISVSDLLEVLSAFSGGSYPFAPPGSGDEGT